MIIGGVTLGVYVGGWLCFIGGIAGVVDNIADAINGNGINGLSVAINAVKIAIAGFAGWISAVALIFPSLMILRK
ncbi:hypothetical protein ABD74_17400 [Brevibacillus laterosporus]|nr:hypothetical protein [Brevibacillus laterosporus]